MTNRQIKLIEGYIRKVVISEISKTKNRLKENQEDEMMSDQEVKDEVLDKIKELGRNVNQWSARDTLKQFTSWGFWSGGHMASIDVPLAQRISKELYDYIKDLRPGSGDIDEVYELLSR